MDQHDKNISKESSTLSSQQSALCQNLWKKVNYYSDIPRDAFQAGIFQEKQQYIGKYTSKTDGYSFVGPVFVGKGLISIHGESNFAYRSYDILIESEILHWKPFVGLHLPDGAIPAVDTVHGKGYIGQHLELGVGMVVCKQNEWTFISKNKYHTSNFDVLCMKSFDVT